LSLEFFEEVLVLKTMGVQGHRCLREVVLDYQYLDPKETSSWFLPGVPQASLLGQKSDILPGTLTSFMPDASCKAARRKPWVFFNSSLTRQSRQMWMQGGKPQRNRNIPGEA